ncbi:MAG: hypothetical protein KF831_14490 [Acidobacteria bacterium]|nr:hypothetical protein [Acidobacteriota bacterium]
MKCILAILIFVLLAMSMSGCNCASSNNHGTKVVGSWKLLSKEIGIIPGPVSVETDLIFFDENEGIATNIFQVSRTVDGGKEWIRGHDFYPQDITVSLFILAEDQSVLGVGWKHLDEERRAPAVVHSNDRGKTWTQLEIDFGDEKKLTNGSISFVDICFESPDIAWLASDVGLVEISLHEQAIRIEKVLRTEEKLFSVSCSSTGPRVVVVGKGAVYRYGDQGVSRLYPPSDFTYSRVRQIDNDIWLLGWKRLHSNSNSVDTGESGIILFSGDGGSTWENRTPKEIRFFSDIEFRKGKGWLTGSDGSLFYSDDNGKSWHHVPVPSTHDLYSIFYLNEQNIWISGLNGTILKYGVD